MIEGAYQVLHGFDRARESRESMQAITLDEGEDGTHDLIWSRSKPKAACCRPPTAPHHCGGAVFIIYISGLLMKFHVTNGKCK